MDLTADSAATRCDVLAGRRVLGRIQYAVIDGNIPDRSGEDCGTAPGNDPTVPGNQVDRCAAGNPNTDWWETDVRKYTTWPKAFGPYEANPRSFWSYTNSHNQDNTDGTGSYELI